MYKQCTKPKRKRDDSWFKDKVLLLQAQPNGQVLREEELALLADPGVLEFQNIQTIITHNAAYQADDLDAFDSDCDELNTTQVALIANLSCFGSDALNKVHNPDNFNNITNQDVQVMPSFEQSSVVNHSETRITIILSMIEQLKTQVVNYTQTNLNNKSVNDTLTAELEIYKEQIKVLKEGQNVEITSKYKFSDSHEQNAEIDSLKQSLSKQLQEKESLMKTVTVLKNDFKKEESRNINREIALDNRIKHLDNIQLEPKLYDGNVIPNTYTIEIPDSEETLMLTKESRSKMLLKQQDPMVLENKDKVKKDIEEIEMINIELDHRVSKLIAENKHLKQTYKQLYDSIKPACVRSKEQCDTLINQVNQKSVEISDLNAKLQEQGLELLIIIRQTCPSINNPNDKLVAVTPKNKDKRVRFAEPITSFVVEPQGTANVQHSKLNANSELICVKCNGCMLFDNHDLCVINSVNDVHAKSKSIKKISKRKVWKPTGKVFTNIRYTWRPTGRTFTIVGNECPLTRITTTTEVPPRKPITLEIDTPKPVVTLVYSMKPMKPKTTDLVGKTKKNKSISTNKKEPSKSWGSTVSDDPSSSLTDCRLSKLFSVAFRPYTCFIRNLEGDDLVTRPRGNNLYTLSIGDMMASSPICILSKASKTKSWLWHRRLSHLNFGVINHLSRHCLIRGLPKLKFEKDHLCSTNAIGKSQKKPHKPKSKDTNQENLNLLHMDLYGPMRVEPF
ncbi:retrovirus-related pol polyprotein from transposon TNT 1-94 [Tanacetum coccineum]